MIQIKGRENSLAFYKDVDNGPPSDTSAGVRKNTILLVPLSLFVSNSWSSDGRGREKAIALSLNVAEILGECQLFARIESREFQRLATIARLCNFDKGHVIFRERDECPGIHVLGSGLVRVFKTGPNGKEHVLHMIGPGNTFAEVAAIGGFRCPASAEAVAPTVTALLPYGPFRQLLETDQQLCREMMIGMAVWVRHLVDLLEDVVLRDAVGRLARYLLIAPSEADVVELPTLKRHLANHLNLTSETFSRTIRRLADAGLIAEPDAYHVRLVDRKRLQQVADGLATDL